LRTSACSLSLSLSLSLSTDWKDQLLEFAAEVFERGTSGKASAPVVVDIKALHAKIGELTLENDFLEAALGKAGLPSARR